MTTKREYKIKEANADWPLPNSNKKKIESAKREIFKREKMDNNQRQNQMKKKRKKLTKKLSQLTWSVGQPDQIFIYYIKLEVQLEFNQIQISF